MSMRTVIADLIGTHVNKEGDKENCIPQTTAETVSHKQANDITVDIITRHAFPALERMEKSDQDTYVNCLQVIKKIEELGIDTSTLLYPELGLQKLEQTIQEMESGNTRGMDVVEFTGTTSQELQEAIDINAGNVLDIRSDKIIVSETIKLKNDTHIRGNGVELICSGTEFVMFGEHLSKVSIDRVKIAGNADYGIFMTDSSDFRITGCTISDMKQKAICIVEKASGFLICRNHFMKNQSGSLYIAGEVTRGLIDENYISCSDGTSNWMAGLVLTHAAPDIKWDIWEKFDPAHRCPRRGKISGETNCPHDILIRNNQITDNRSSGIYADGAYRCFVTNNTINQNDKEGICLDYGTFGFYLKENIVKENGKRGHQTDEELEMDFVLGAGRMADGSAKAKLPGVSIDNAAYNILENNIIAGNYGSGIKMVRTSVRNLINENIVRDNNRGKNDMYHFFGIEAGWAPADLPGEELDYTPSFENIICRNSIVGNHYAGVFVGQECYVNDVFDNIIMETELFAVEAISHKFNSIVNNVSLAENRIEC